MKRTNYLIATILAAIVLAGQLVLNAWTTLIYLRVFLGGPFPIDALYVLGIQGLIDAVILVAFILTLIGIKYIGKDKETFRKGFALIITNIVFTFLVVAILVYMGLRSSATADQTYTIINWASAGILFITNILYIVDLAKEKNRGEAPKVAEPVAEQPVAVEEPKVEVAPAKAEKKPVAKKATTTKKPATKTTAKKPAAKKPTAKTPTAKTPAKKTATAKKPATAAKKPTAEKKTTKK